MTTVPLFGNEGYTGITSSATQIQRADIVNLVTGNLENQLVNSNYIWLVPGGSSKKLYSVTGNSSLSFNTLTDGSPQFLNALPNQPASITVSGGVLTIPKSATIVAAYARDSGLVGPTSLDIGTCAITGGAPLVSGDLFTTAATTDVRAGVYVSSQVVYDVNSRMASPGVAATGTTQVSVSGTGSTGITVTPNGFDVTGSLGLTVTVYYYI